MLTPLHAGRIAFERSPAKLVEGLIVPVYHDELL